MDCDFYTDNLCLEVSNYPAKKIVALLNVNCRVGADLIADVVDQSADNLIDGVTAGETKFKMSIDFYFFQFFTRFYLQPKKTSILFHIIMAIASEEKMIIMHIGILPKMEDFYAHQVKNFFPSFTN